MGQSLNKDDIDAIADQIIAHVKERKHEFWIEPEEHYNDHRRLRSLKEDEFNTLKDVVRTYRATRSLFLKAFLGFAMVGMIGFALWGLMFGVRH